MKPQLISVNQLNKQSHTAYYDLLYQHANGMTQHYQMLSRNTNLNKDNLGKNNIDAITMLIYRKTVQNINEYLIIKEFRLPINNFVLSFPAGLVEKNEDIKSAAIREIKEETGIICNQYTKFDFQRPILSSPGITDELGQIVIVELDGSETFGQKELEDTEIISTKWMTYNEINNVLDNEQIHIGNHAYVHIQKLEILNQLSILK